ncbi:ribonuclease E/G [Rhodobacter capsulatus]|uniref:Rne/Rng family ribonuclease n=1 Tax=Rhodobacter capsulatus TaxID=1061 RepID=UPI0006DC8170|nr:ribonuclease E/G [Rhodobacter capsulatus]KQB12240.1 ribonuclease [Rhodobacter capsulatus]KQB12618.1 ribonuclease [Rhodobacter capsulatus]PZX23302.1 ribonuclease E [Rhodobacter capsulatus]QNR61685.1 ribonuclease E/G [Rhodobacter capsulatus]
MAKKMLIDATHAEETRVVVVDGNKVDEFDFETVNKRQLAGNIYLAKVTRVEPSLQAAFVDYGGNRHGFLAFAEIHPDYYQIPVADRQALLEEERLAAEAEEAEENRSRSRRSRSRSGSSRSGGQQARAEKATGNDAVLRSEDIPGMAVIDEAAPGEEAGALEPLAAEADILDTAPEQGFVLEEGAAEVETAEEGEAEEAEAPREIEEDHDHEHDHDHHVHPVDDEIESVAEEDVAEEIHAPRRPRARRYKIQEVIKVRQIMLVQVVKEERGNKGAALTTYLSLAGRYCVLMPNTARGGGISRKITNAADRKKLKEIAGEMEVPQGAGLIIRTAGSQRTRTEIRRDYEYLMRLWEQIRELTLKSIAPAPIYEEGDLIKRSIRDLYSKDIDEVLVEGERGYRVAKDFMKMIMPSHAKNVKHYNEQLPLFARFQVESYLASMFNPVVQLKSGGYIVIGVTEALVAIDVNSGRATKEGSIEETALKTNLEASEEISRQLRLRDLAGLIVIDFIDMEERKNNAAVEKRLKEKLKTDRARIQVGRISGFGLMEMSRQRLRPGMLESTTQPCPHCHGTGLIRSDDSLALQVLRAIEEEGTRKRSREVLVKCPVAVANYLMNAKREHIASIEARYGMAVRIEADPTLVSPDFSIEKFKTATRIVPEVHSAAVHASAELMAEIDEEEIVEEEEDEVEEAAPAVAVAATGEPGEGSPKKKKRRRRRRKKNGAPGGTDLAAEGDEGDDGEDDGEDEGDDASDEEAAEDAARAAAAAELADVSLPVLDAEAEVQAPVAEAAAAPEAAPEEPAPKPSRSRSRSSKAKKEAEAVDGVEAPVKKTRTRTTSKAKKEAEAAAAAAAAAAEAPVAEAAPEAVEAPEALAPVVAPVSEAAPESVVESLVETETAPQPEVAPQPEPVAEAAAEVAVDSEPEAENDPDSPEDQKPKKRGWWSLG